VRLLVKSGTATHIVDGKVLQFPVAQFECYSKGEKTGSDFIKCIGYKFGAVI
jgi:hypothetical protein